MCEACIAECYRNLGTNERLQGLLASCDLRNLTYMSKVRWQDKITNEESEEDVDVEWRTLNIE